MLKNIIIGLCGDQGVRFFSDIKTRIGTHLVNGYK